MHIFCLDDCKPRQIVQVLIRRSQIVGIVTRKFAKLLGFGRV